MVILLLFELLFSNPLNRCIFSHLQIVVIVFMSRVGVVVVDACWLVLGWCWCCSSCRTPVLLVVLASIHAESRFRLLLLIRLRCYQFIWPLWCWDDVDAVLDDTSELPVDLTSAANLFLFLTHWMVGEDPEISYSKYFYKSPFSFSLDWLRSRKCQACHTCEFSNSQCLTGS